MLKKISQSSILALLLSGCGSKPTDTYNGYVHPSLPLPSIDISPILQPYISEYLDSASLFKVDTSLVDKLRIVEFGTTATDQDQDVVGVCNTYTRSDTNALAYTKITISTEYEDQSARDATPNLFKALLYHELTHCILLRGHEPQDPEVIMSPILSNDAFYERNWTQLVNELFTGTPVQYIPATR